jgi:hypothetical protein
MSVMRLLAASAEPSSVSNEMAACSFWEAILMP